MGSGPGDSYWRIQMAAGEVTEVCHTSVPTLDTWELRNHGLEIFSMARNCLYCCPFASQCFTNPNVFSERSPFFEPVFFWNINHVQPRELNPPRAFSWNLKFGLSTGTNTWEPLQLMPSSAELEKRCLGIWLARALSPFLHLLREKSPLVIWQFAIANGEHFYPPVI